MLKKSFFWRQIIFNRDDKDRTLPLEFVEFGMTKAAFLPTLRATQHIQKHRL